MKLARNLALLLAPALLLTASNAAAQWSTESLTVPRSRVGMTTVGSKVLIAGGIAVTGYSDVVDIYDDETGQWSTATLSSHAGFLGATTVGPYAMFAGTGLSRDHVDVYDDTTGLWSSVPLSSPFREGISAVTVGTKAIFAGGGFAGIGVTTIDVYDSAIGTPSDALAWSTVNLWYGRFDIESTAIGERAYLVGGHTGLASYWMLDIYDAVSNTVQAVPKATDFAPFGITSVGQELFTVATGWPPFGIPEVTFVELLDVASGTWSVERLDLTRRFTGVATVGHRVLIAGGRAGQVAVDRVDVFDTVSRAWSTQTLPEAASHQEWATVGTKTFFAGLSGSNLVHVFDDSIGAPYCTPAMPNSTGMSATIRAQGAPAIAVDGSTRLTIQGMPDGALGYVLASQTQGMSMPASSDGVLCLGGAILRFVRPGEVLSGPAGQLAIHHADLPASGASAIQPGETWNYQCWFRDGNPGPTSNFTDAVAVSYL